MVCDNSMERRASDGLQSNAGHAVREATDEVHCPAAANPHEDGISSIQLIAVVQKGSDSSPDLVNAPSCLPKELLRSGKFRFGDSGEFTFDTLPPWFDLRLARKGQLFAQGKLYAVFLSHLMGLYFLLGSSGLKILYHTGKSHTGEKSLKRYLATMLQVKLWYESAAVNDTNCPFFTSLKNVRKVHACMGKRVQQAAPDFSKPIVQPDDDAVVQDDNQYWEGFLTDLLSSENGREIHEKAIANGSPFNPSALNDRTPYYFSQFDMALTQWSFVSMPLLFSKSLGLEATQEQFEAYIHLWAVIGHCLGMEPQYNICLAKDVESFRDISLYLYETEYLPSFTLVTYENGLMWKALTDGMVHVIPFLTLDCVLIDLLEDYIRVPAVELWKKASLRSKWRRFLKRLIIKPLLRFQWFQRFANNYVNYIVAKATLKYRGHSSSDYETIASKAFY